MKINCELYDYVNFMFLQELGTGKYVLPELCKQLEVSRSNFNASLIRLKKEIISAD